MFLGKIKIKSNIKILIKTSMQKRKQKHARVVVERFIWYEVNVLFAFRESFSISRALEMETGQSAVASADCWSLLLTCKVFYIRPFFV